MGRSEMVRIDGKVVAETPRAICIEVDEGAGPPVAHWFPLSTVHELHKQDGYIVVDHWIANKEGLA